ncbi:hypothetical protein OSIRIS_63 [Brevibacillus phage Osiris]|uniref:Uncharacterized protein n=3 Tax=Caudoviricetes TaxID=2731619 RepID=S5MUS7_9CAUD|nr:hypothetical protein DAVIES_55 [Brevibacillus phage Davies]YP_009215077.1 hypothetical protein AVV10_gp063 [Brevibacillus phage Osiris]AGR47582.1 hypothetical protein DAVIES_55 [Brevibacillus phage Davies]ALA07326.1 hypothetical protein OSIRIS_63 [Brevibacillus phage Osiris]ALA48073.1 hypothetical protein POWDER_63 [Brevibacillus phage Powder]
MNPMEIDSKLRSLRKATGFSISDIATKINISQLGETYEI